MAALTQDRNTKCKHLGRSISVKLLANAVIFKGAIVCADAAGWGIPGADTAGIVILGIAAENVDNTGGANGALSVRVRKGVFALNDKAANPPLQADIGRPVYIDTDNEVAVIAGVANNIVAGILDSIVGNDYFVSIRDQA